MQRRAFGLRSGFSLVVDEDYDVTRDCAGCFYGFDRYQGIGRHVALPNFGACCRYFLVLVFVFSRVIIFLVTNPSRNL